METYYQPTTASTNYNYSSYHHPHHHHHDQRHHHSQYYQNGQQNDLHWSGQDDYSYQNYYNAHYDNWYYHQQQHPQAMLAHQGVAVDVEVPPTSPDEPIPAHVTALALSNVVHKILAHCSIQDLKSFRQINTLWAKESCKILRDRVIIHFNRDWQLKSYFKRMKDHRDFCSTFCFGTEISLNDSLVQDWINCFGPYIASLELQTCNLQISTLMQAVNHLPNLERLILPSEIVFCDTNASKEVTPCQLPKLKFLTFSRDGTTQQESENPTNNIQSLFHEMLKMSPNLEYIRIQGPIPITNQFLLKNTEITDLNVPTTSSIENNNNNSSSLDNLLWSTLINCEESAQKLTKLDFNVPLGQSCVQSLVAKNFPLIYIDLKILPQVSNKALHELLTSLKETLIQLKIRYCGGRRLAYEADLPLTQPLHNLTSVHLERYQGSLWFVEKLPNLSQLSFSKTNLNRVVLKDAECPLKTERVHGTLKSFRVYQDSSNNAGNNRQRSIQTVQKLGMQFPFVKNLRLERLVDESLCLIYAQWPNLEVLEIVHGTFTDAGITAIHPNAYGVILREEAYDNFNVDALRQGLFLGNLAKLTSLKIHSPNITDVSIILGLLPCPNIQSVSIQSFKITDSSMYRLVCKPTIMHLTTKNCNQLTTTAITYTKNTLANRGGSFSLNKSIGSLNVFQTVQFLEKSPKLRVLIKRLSNKVVSIKQKPEKSSSTKRRKTKMMMDSSDKLMAEQVEQAQVLQETKIMTIKPIIQPTTQRRMRIRTTRCYNKREKVQKVQKDNVIFKNDVDNDTVVKDEIVQPSTNVSSLPIIIKSSRPVRNTESIFRRFKDYALFN